MNDRDDRPQPGDAAPPASNSRAEDPIEALFSQPPMKRPPGLRATVGELGAAAVEYTMRGLAVFPCYTVVNGRCSCRKGEQCDRPGKHPKTRRGLNDASRDPNVVLRWWRADPTANIGIATGRIGHLLVLDIDGAAGEAELVALAAKHELLPATPQVWRNGGRPCYLGICTSAVTAADTPLAPIPWASVPALCMARGSWPLRCRLTALTFRLQSGAACPTLARGGLTRLLWYDKL